MIATVTPGLAPTTTGQIAAVPSPGTKPILATPPSGQATATMKKPLVPRGIPPPVPPNKPVVPPKKEAAAYMRRADPTQQMQDSHKMNKLQSTCSTTVPVATPGLQQTQATPGVNPSHQVPDEVSVIP